MDFNLTEHCKGSCADRQPAKFNFLPKFPAVWYIQVYNDEREEEGVGGGEERERENVYAC